LGGGLSDVPGGFLLWAACYTLIYYLYLIPIPTQITERFMNTHADKTTETQSNAVANGVAVQQSAEHEGTFKLEDNRPETIAQRKIQDAANNSPQVTKLKAIQAMANSSPQVKQLRAVQAMANGNAYNPNQLKAINEDETVQGKFKPVQRKLQAPADPGENKTGLPDNLKSGVENLSGYSLNDVKVHYNSDKPAQLNALAYAQGTDIHVASGQERHLPHEAWHVVQQKQGRVQTTMQMKSEMINDDTVLETEADVMGAKALETHNVNAIRQELVTNSSAIQGSAPVQGVFEINNIDYNPLGGVFSTGVINNVNFRDGVNTAINNSAGLDQGHKNIRNNVLPIAIPNNVLDGLQEPDIDAMAVRVRDLIITEYGVQGRPIAGSRSITLKNIITTQLVANLGADTMTPGEQADFDNLMLIVTNQGGVPSRAKGNPTQLAFDNLPALVSAQVTQILAEIRTERALWQRSTLLLNAPLLASFVGIINDRQGNNGHYQGNHTNNAGWLPGVAVPIDQVTPLAAVIAASPSPGVATILNHANPADQLAIERTRRSTVFTQYAGAFGNAVYGSGLTDDGIKLSAMAAMCQGVSAYIEFWMGDTNISRMLYNPVTNQVYITAHYQWRQGYNPFIEVTGFPAV
jgi:hypothetical protein